MKQLRLQESFFVSLACLLISGCASTNVNPHAPEANMGYVDFCLVAQKDLAWEIQNFEPESQRFETVFSELDPVEGGVVRLAFAPGPQRLRVSFLNRVIIEPAIVDVIVQDARVTPIQISLVQAGRASVETREYRWGGSAKGYYGRHTKVGSDEATTFRVVADVLTPKPYAPKSTPPHTP
jgi:hypothetical protein